MTTVAVIFRRLGPYHYARLRAARQHLRIIAIEVSMVDDDYAWEEVWGGRGCERTTLFHGRDLTCKSKRNIVQRVRHALEDAQPEAVAVPGWSDPSALAALDWCQQNCRPAIVMSESSAHDRLRLPWGEVFKRSILRLCGAALVGGRLHRQYLVELGMPLERIFTGYDVVDNDHFIQRSDAVRRSAQTLRHQLGLPPRYFLACSRFVAKKNLSSLLKAYVRYRQMSDGKGWHLVILGDGELRAKLTQQRAKLGIDDYVLMPGFKQYDELPVYYGLADAFVHASVTEQWGLVVNEAMSARLPVLVSSRCGCLPELVHDNRNGLTFAPRDVEGLASRMNGFARGAYDLTSMGQQSRQIISDWTPRTFAMGLKSAVDMALSAPRRYGCRADRFLLKSLLRTRSAGNVAPQWLNHKARRARKGC